MSENSGHPQIPTPGEHWTTREEAEQGAESSSAQCVARRASPRANEMGTAVFLQPDDQRLYGEVFKGPCCARAQGARVDPRARGNVDPSLVPSPFTHTVQYLDRWCSPARCALSSGAAL